MKKVWFVQFFALTLHYFGFISDVSHDGIEFSPTPLKDLVYILFHATLFLSVNYVLIPKFFYRKKQALFFVFLILLIIIYGVLEEGVVEKILDPNRRGLNAVTWQSIYWFFGEVLIPLLAFITIKIVFDYFENQQKLEQIKKNSIENELKFLKSQIQPHILFNSLNNLYSYTLAKSDKAPELVLQLSNVLRYILYETTTKLVLLSKELMFVKDYIALQELQLEGRGKLSFKLVENQSFDNLKIAPFLLIPFIENSFKHSLKSQARGVEVVIKIEIQDKQLKLITINNFKKEQVATTDLTTRGVGLNNVKKRLALLYPNQYDLKIEEIDSFYHVELSLNLK